MSETEALLSVIRDEHSSNSERLEALETLLTRNYRRLIYKAIFEVLRSSSDRSTIDVDECFNEIAMRLLVLAADRFPADHTKFPGWLRAVARNCTLTIVKQVGRTAKASEPLDLQVVEPVDQNAGPEEAVVEHQDGLHRRRIASRASSRLQREVPDGDRYYYVLSRRSQRATYDQIAAELNVSAGTVRNLEKKARVHMTRLIEEERGER